jgi:GNAT superfamily N-acetyltransferase
MLAALRADIRTLGFGNWLLYAIDRACRRAGLDAAVTRYILVAQPVPDGPLLPARRGAAIAVRELAIGDPALAAMPVDRAELENRARIGAVGFGAFQDGRMIGYLWLVVGPYDEAEVRLRFVPAPEGRTSWDFDVYLHPEHRIGFGFAKLWETANAHLRARGVAWTISRISAINALSLASHRRLGAVQCGSVTTIRIGRFHIYISPRRPWVRCSAGRGAWAEFRIEAPNA